jgi:hypothetical protein
MSEKPYRKFPGDWVWTASIIGCVLIWALVIYAVTRIF